MFKQVCIFRKRPHPAVGEFIAFNVMQ